MLKLNSKLTKIETKFSNCSSSLLLPASPCHHSMRICCMLYHIMLYIFFGEIMSVKCEIQFMTFNPIQRYARLSVLLDVDISHQCTQWRSAEVCVEAPRLAWRPVDAPQLSAHPSYRNPEHFQTLYIQFLLDAEKEPFQSDYQL